RARVRHPRAGRVPASPGGGPHRAGAEAGRHERDEAGERMTEGYQLAESTEPLLEVTVRVNGTPRTAAVPARRLLSDFLRHDLGLTGTHVGCEHGVCGACTVLVDGEPMRSCLMFAVSAQEHEVTTVEGIGDDPADLSPVQQAFTECHG